MMSAIKWVSDSSERNLKMKKMYYKIFSKHAHTHDEPFSLFFHRWLLILFMIVISYMSLHKAHTCLPFHLLIPFIEQLDSSLCVRTHNSEVVKFSIFHSTRRLNRWLEARLRVLRLMIRLFIHCALKNKWQ